MVVACVAGLGAWGAAKVTVSNGDTIYASELFGTGHSSPVYPTGMTPMVVLAIPANVAPVADNPDTADDETVKEVNHSGSVEVTFSLTGGAVFNSNITGLMWDNNTGDTTAAVAAPGAVASIKSGGRKGDSSITIMVEEGAAGGRPTLGLGGDQLGTPHTISFTMPRLASLGALAGATDKAKSIYLTASSRIISGAFTDGPLSGVAPWYVVPVVNARDSLTLEIAASNDGMNTIAIDDDAAKGMTAFKSLKETIAAGKAGAGHVALATVTIKTKQLKNAGTDATSRTTVGYLQDSRFASGDNNGKAFDCTKVDSTRTDDASGGDCDGNDNVDFQSTCRPWAQWAPRTTTSTTSTAR